MLNANYRFMALVFTGWCVAFSAAAEPLATAQPYEPPIARLIIGLLLCVFLAYVIAHTLRNFRRDKGAINSLFKLKMNKNQHNTNAVTVMETHRLNSTSDVCLISWEEEEFLVIIGQHEPKLLNDKHSLKMLPKGVEGNK